MSHIIICIKDTDNTDKQILPGYVRIESEYKSDKMLCWNCCHECSCIKYLPLKYNKSVFYVNGIFCSDECSFRYLYDTYKDKELWEKFQLMKFYHKKIYGNYIDIKLPPNRLVLKNFGGSMDIETYRNNIYNYELNIPPVVIVNNQDIGDRKVKKDSEYLKLYRKKKDKNTILNNFDKFD